MKALYLAVCEVHVILESRRSFSSPPATTESRDRARSRRSPKVEYFCIPDSQFRLRFRTSAFWMWICEKVSRPAILTVEFCTGAGAVKSRGKTAGVPREREEQPHFIPRECRERDWLLRESRGTGSKRRSPPAGAGVTLGSLVGLLLLLFGLYLPLSLYLSCFRFSVHFRQSFWMNTFLMFLGFYAAWYELRT